VTIRRGSLPAIIGVGAVAVSIAVASAIAATSGGAPAGGALSIPVPKTSASVGPAGTAGGSNVDSAGMTVSLPAAGGHVAGGSDPWASATGSPPPSTGSGKASSDSAAQAGSPPRQLIVPDIIAAAPGGLTAAEIASISKLGQVRAVLPIDGARIAVSGRPVNVLAAPAATLRPWTPPATAADSGLWSDFASGDLITTASVATGLSLRSGQSYQVTAATQARLTFGADALLGVPGVDGIVNVTLATRLGLVRNVAVLINAPAAQMDTLVSQVKGVIGGGQVVRLVPQEVVTQLPVDTQVPTGRPTNYLTLYQESAAQYCPGLSWTVLAAIGEIESDDGQNMGPSSAGALGPMQFLPSTWATWGTDGFGNTGPPDIMNALDAVPSAARMLCADGAAQGGQSLWNAIFDYNHASWYVDEVLSLADEYAREYG
jgi:hypothetical protein